MIFYEMNNYVRFEMKFHFTTILLHFTLTFLCQTIFQTLSNNTIHFKAIQHVQSTKTTKEKPCNMWLLETVKKRDMSYTFIKISIVSKKCKTCCCLKILLCAQITFLWLMQ